jgi:YgiT-type zinc finger domain-containing protein
MKIKNESRKALRSCWPGARCETCGGSSIKDAVVEVYRHRGNKRYLFQGVPAGVCADCGTRYFTGHAARMMEERIRQAGSSKKRKTVTLPVLSLV